MLVVYTVSCSDNLHIAMDGAHASDVSSIRPYLHFVTLKRKKHHKIRAMYTTDGITYCICTWSRSLHFIKRKKTAV